MNKIDKTALVPKYRFPEFESRGSVVCENGNLIFEPISNKNHNSDLPVLAITQEHGAIPREEIDYTVSVSKKGLENYKVVEKGDFIISLRSFQGGIEYSMHHGICSPAYIILRKKVDIVDQYYKHYFKSYRFIQDLNKDLEGIRDGKMVSYNQFSAILLPKPDKEEQQKIADCLSSLDELIFAEDKKLTALKEHKKGLMQKLFPAEGKTLPEWRFPEFSGCGDWESIPIGKKVDLLSGYAFKGEEISQNRMGIPLMRGINITEGYVRHNVDIDRFFCGCLNGLEKYKLQQGDLVIGMDGSKVGKNSALITLDDTGSLLIQRVARLRANIDTTIKFIFQHINSGKFHSYVDRINTSSGIPHISAKQIEEFKIYFPPEETEQQKIADLLSSVDDLITAQSEKIESLKEHKKGLMQGLFPSIEEVAQ